MAAVKTNFRGAVVYNTGVISGSGSDIPAGVYVWDGKWWTPFGGGANTVKDKEGNEYTIGYFSDAGVWMTQDLRSTQYDDGMLLTMGASTDVTLKYYNYPGTAATAEARRAALTTEQLEAYGLLYSWAAASGRTDSNQDNNTNSAGYGANPPGATHHQGICPKDWHLPSDYEWSQLEQEIASHPEEYSSQITSYDEDYDFFPSSDGYEWRPGDASGQDDTYWGRQMKSEKTYVNSTNPNGSSFLRKAGGFDALLVGYVNYSGTPESYGSYAYFWSSNSDDSSNGMSRTLVNSYKGVLRRSNNKSVLFSVRCKKD
jgi:uncharacterized protein (TIGR02145 family)